MFTLTVIYVASLVCVLNDLRNFNEISRENVTYINIQSHRKVGFKAGFHPLSRKCNFGKIIGGSN